MKALICKSNNPHGSPIFMGRLSCDSHLKDFRNVKMLFENEICLNKYLSLKLYNNNAFYTNSNVLLFPRKEVDLIRVRNRIDVFFNFY